MLRSRKGRELAAAMPLDRLLTETDAPFARDGENPLMPWQAYDCLGELEMISNLGVGTLSLQLKSNFKKIIKFNE